MHSLLSITTHRAGCRSTQNTCGVPSAPERSAFWPNPNRTSAAPSHYLLQAPGHHGAPNSPVTHCLFPVLLINWQESSCQRTRSLESQEAEKLDIHPKLNRCLIISRLNLLTEHVTNAVPLQHRGGGQGGGNPTIHKGKMMQAPRSVP